MAISELHEFTKYLQNHGRSLSSNLSKSFVDTNYQNMTLLDKPFTVFASALSSRKKLIEVKYGESINENFSLPESYLSNFNWQNFSVKLPSISVVLNLFIIADPLIIFQAIADPLTMGAG